MCDDELEQTSSLGACCGSITITAPDILTLLSYPCFVSPLLYHRLPMDHKRLGYVSKSYTISCFHPPYHFRRHWLTVLSMTELRSRSDPCYQTQASHPLSAISAGQSSKEVPMASSPFLWDIGGRKNVTQSNEPTRLRGWIKRHWSSHKQWYAVFSYVWSPGSLICNH